MTAKKSGTAEEFIADGLLDHNSLSVELYWRINYCNC